MESPLLRPRVFPGLREDWFESQILVETDQRLEYVNQDRVADRFEIFIWREAPDVSGEKNGYG